MQEFQFKGKPAYKGMTVCPNCQKEFSLTTTNKELFGKARCIKCFMDADIEAQKQAHTKSLISKYNKRKNI